MKQFFAMLVGMFASSLYAHDVFFIAPSVGIGMGSTHSNVNSAFWVYNDQKPSFVFTYGGGSDIGYRRGKWEFSTGIQYLVSGYSHKYDGGDLITMHIMHREYEQHIVVPVMADRIFGINKKCFVSIGLGGAYLHNIIVKEHEEQTLEGTSVTSTSDNTYKGDMFDAKYSRTAFSGIVRARFMYMLSPRVNIFAGPQFQYMFTSLLKKSDYSDFYQNNYVANMHFGAQFTL